MTTISFDALKFVERLEKAGVAREQAVAMAQAQQESLAEVMDSQLATKTDVRAARDDLIKVERRMDGIDAKLDKLTWMAGLVIAGIAAQILKTFFG